MARDARGSYNPITIKGNSGGNTENKLIKKKTIGPTVQFTEGSKGAGSLFNGL